MVTLQSIFAANARIAGISLKTPLVPSVSLSGSGQRDVRLKLETTQPIGAFKLRGAANTLAQLDSEKARNGVTCASTGNHGRAVAYAAKRLGIPATICMSSLVPGNKVAAIKALGANVKIIGESQDDAQVEVDRLVAEEGMTDVPPFDHADVVAGQGTIGLEILNDFPEVDTVIVPLSGGGLIGGIALAVKSANPDIRVIGVTMERGAAMHASLRAGKPVTVTEEPTLADSLGGGIGLGNQYTFDLAQRYIDEIVLLSEEQIAAGMAHLFWHEGLVTEGAAAVGAAVLLEEAAQHVGQHVAVIVSGRNIDMNEFHRIVDEGRPK